MLNGMKFAFLLFSLVIFAQAPDPPKELTPITLSTLAPHGHYEAGKEYRAGQFYFQFIDAGDGRNHVLLVRGPKIDAERAIITVGFGVTAKIPESTELFLTRTLIAPYAGEGYGAADPPIDIPVSQIRMVRVVAVKDVAQGENR